MSFLGTFASSNNTCRMQLISFVPSNCQYFTFASAGFLSKAFTVLKFPYRFANPAVLNLEPGQNSQSSNLATVWTIQGQNFGWGKNFSRFRITQTCSNAFIFTVCVCVVKTLPFLPHRINDLYNYLAQTNYVACFFHSSLLPTN